MASADSYDSSGIEYYNIPSFTFASGTTLHNVRVAYKSINPESTHGAILIPTCYGGLINETLSHTSPANDCLAKYHVIVAAMLGNGESASPSNKAFFPLPSELRYQDVIRAHHTLLTDHLHLDVLEAVIGFSMGAQQAYHWGVMYPDFVKRIVPVCGSARTSGHNYAFIEGPIGALTNSIDYIAWRQMKEKVARGEDVGVNLREVRPKRGLRAFGRAYSAWLTSHRFFDQGLWREEGKDTTIEEWIQQMEEGFLPWDAEDLLVLGRMWQMGDVGTVMPGKETLSHIGGAKSDDDRYHEALRGIKAKCLVMPCRTDQYFPPHDSEVEVEYLRDGRLCVIESVWGHVAGGGMNPEDVKFMDQEIGKFMSEPLK